MELNIISLFSGCGGLDLGFQKADFNIIWANDNAKSIWKTYKENHPLTVFCPKSIQKIRSNDIPDNIVGIIGGPPCQSWSNAGKGKGLSDRRGRLFFEFVRIINDKNPLFFVAENVEGMLAKRHSKGLEVVKEILSNAGMGYTLSTELMNAANYGVPQNRKRIFFVGYRRDLGIAFVKPDSNSPTRTVRDAISDLVESALPGISGNKSNGPNCTISNHEYWTGGFSYIFMSRNRVLDWDEPSFTIQASGRQVSIHPQAPPMEKVKKDVMRFESGNEHLYRRLSVRECARIQTFPDSYIFHYDSLNAGYKMIGNAVPVNLAKAVALKVKADVIQALSLRRNQNTLDSNDLVSIDLIQPNSVLCL